MCQNALTRERSSQHVSPIWPTPLHAANFGFEQGQHKSKPLEELEKAEQCVQLRKSMCGTHQQLKGAVGSRTSPLVSEPCSKPAHPVPANPVPANPLPAHPLPANMRVPLTHVAAVSCRYYMDTYSTASHMLLTSHHWSNS